MTAGFHAADNFITWARNSSMFGDKPFVDAWKSNSESLAGHLSCLASIRFGMRGLSLRAT
jgi:hypothetical protein